MNHNYITIDLKSETNESLESLPEKGKFAVFTFYILISVSILLIIKGLFLFGSQKKAFLL